MRDAGVRTAPSQACTGETMATAGIRSRWGRGRGGLPTGAELRVGEAFGPDTGEPCDAQSFSRTMNGQHWSRVYGCCEGSVTPESNRRPICWLQSARPVGPVSLAYLLLDSFLPLKPRRPTLRPSARAQMALTRPFAWNCPPGGVQVGIRGRSDLEGSSRSHPG